MQAPRWAHVRICGLTTNKRTKKGIKEMTTEEKRIALDGFCDEHDLCEGCPLYVPELKCGMGEHFCVTDEARMSDADIDRAYRIVFPNRMGVEDENSGFQETVEKIQECGIKDSGARRRFDTGAVRDIQEGKGRCDLLPLDVIASYYANDEVINDSDCRQSWVFYHLGMFQKDGQIKHLRKAINMWNIYTNAETLFLEVAKHFEEGCKKYGENNWQKGIPTHCYIDSAVRHYLKWARGDKDEPHDRAFVWNILCCIWTCIHKPELNDYAKGEDADHEETHSN